MTIIVTGSAGFIGFHTAKKLLEHGHNVIGIDNFNDYYDVQIKEDRNKILEENKNFKLYRVDLGDEEAIKRLFEKEKIDKICHLGAQAGVRYSIENPQAYENANIKGTLNLLEAARHNNIKDFIFASSSSVYGNQEKVPFSETDNIDYPISFYAATKKANELMAYTYHHLYGLNCVGFRFFTVYGPWGRPDMALFKFTKLILEDKPIPVFNAGKHSRDFTYIDDIVNSFITAIENPFSYEIINLGNNTPVELLDYIATIEKAIGKKAKKEMLPLQDGDVEKTYADIEKAQKLLNYNPKTDINIGIKNFVDWYREYYSV